MFVVHSRQKGNPVLDGLRTVKWMFADAIAADFEFNGAVWGLFLSLRYHRLHPALFAKRIDALRNKVKQLVIFCLVDVDDYNSVLLEVGPMPRCVPPWI